MPHYVNSPRLYGFRNPKAVHNPLRSMPLFTPAEQFFGPSPLVKATAALDDARMWVRQWGNAYQAARAELGNANRFGPATRQYWQREAMRKINQARVGLRKAMQKAQAAEIALAALAPATASA